MKDSKKKLFTFIHKHLAGIGLGVVTIPMALTVVKGAAGQTGRFDPGEIDTSFSSGLSSQPDRTGYDLSGEGEDSEQVERQPEQDSDEEDGNGPDLDGAETMQDARMEPIVLPDQVADMADPIDTVDVTVDPQKDGEGIGAGPKAEEGPAPAAGTDLPGTDRGWREDRTDRVSSGWLTIKGQTMQDSILKGSSEMKRGTWSPAILIRTILEGARTEGQSGITRERAASLWCRKGRRRWNWR